MGYELAQKTCIEDGYEETDIVGWGLCRTCYNRHRRRGTIPVPTCPVDGCVNPRHRKSLCLAHREEFTTGPMGYCSNPVCTDPIKPRSAFGPSYLKGYGRARYCWDCRRKPRATGPCPITGCTREAWSKGPCPEHRAEHSSAGMKWCTYPKCETPLQPKSAFNQQVGGWDELASWCRDCAGRDKLARRLAGRDARKRWNAIMIERGVRKRDLAAETAQWMAEQMEEFLAIVSS